MSQNFSGNGFDKSPIEGEEAARIRHMAHELDEVWPYVRDTVTVQKALKVLQSGLKVGLGVGLPIFGLAAYAASQGWIGQ